MLVLRIDERVGNVLLTTPLLVRLAETLPDARLDLLVAASKVGLVRGIVSVIPFQKKDFFRNPLRFLALIRSIRSTRYDVAIDASHWHTFSASSALLLGLTGAKVRIAHDRGPDSGWVTDRVPLPDEHESEIATKLRLLAPLGISPGSPKMCTQIGTDPGAAESIERWLAQTELGQPLVGLSPGGRKSAHRMPPEVFAKIGLHAKRLGARLVVLWGPGEEAIAGQVATQSQAILAPPTDLSALAALVRRCRVVVVNDTGPMHLSVAVGTPTLAMFTQPAEWRWGHHEAPHRMISGSGRSEDEIVREACSALESMLRS